MSQSYQQQIANERESERIIRERLQDTGQKPIYTALNIDKDAFGRFVAGTVSIGLSMFCKILSRLNLKVVDADAKTIKSWEIAVPKEMAESAFNDRIYSLKYQEYYLRKQGCNLSRTIKMEDIKND